MRLATYVTALAMLAVGTANAASTDIYYPPEVVAQVNALTTRADALGFHIGASPDPSMCYHYQGVVRSTGPGTPYFFITKSGNYPGPICVVICSNGLPCTEVGDGPGTLQVVRMGSRGTDGERLRSNRIVRSRETSDSVPDPGDVVVKTLVFNGASGWPNFGHLGGMQMIGDVLAVTLEHPYDQADIDTSQNAIQFIDVSDPENPVKRSTFRFPFNDSTTAGVVSIAAQPSGVHLMLIAGKEGRAVRIFESNGQPLDSLALAWTHKYTWRPSDNPVNPPCWSIPPSSTIPAGLSWGWPAGGFLDYAHQSLTFVREAGPTGQLYLIGTRNDSALPGPFGDDMIDVYRVSWDGATFSLGCATQKHVDTFASSDGSLIFGTKITDFAAGGGVYVSPTGELIVYGTEHENDGPSGTVKMAEFRPRDVTRFGSPTLDPTVTIGGPYSVPEGGSVTVSATASAPRTKAWVQLWADDHWSSDDRYLVIDYPDRALDDFDNFNRLDDANNNPFADGFSDQASSVRWFAPEGCTAWLFDDDFGDSGFPGDEVLRLDGFGEVRTIADLGDSDMGDVFTSMKFDADCDGYYGPGGRVVAWDLNGDGMYETSGASFAFSALNLDGPAIAPLRARVTQSSDGRGGFADSHVMVVNVAPVVSALTLRDGAARVIAPGGFVIVGLPVTLSATFTDPGRADTHAPSIAWGDGGVSGVADLDSFGAATGGGVGSVLDRHRFMVAGSFNVVLTVVDDDGGASSSSFVLRVLSARDAIQIVIDALPAGSKAREHLEGQNNGAANNGALDHLDGGQLNAAMTKIALALGLITDDTLRGTLAMAAQAIAVESYARAVAANPSPNAGTAKKLSDIAARLDSGAAYLGVSNWVAAVDAFADAVRRAAAMS